MVNKNKAKRPQGFLSLLHREKVEMTLMTVEFARLSDPFLDDWISLLHRYRHLYETAGKPTFNCPSFPTTHTDIYSPYKFKHHESLNLRK